MKKWFTKTIGKLLFYKEKIEMFNQEIRKSKESHLVKVVAFFQITMSVSSLIYYKCLGKSIGVTSAEKVPDMENLFDL